MNKFDEDSIPSQIFLLVQSTSVIQEAVWLILDNLFDIRCMEPAPRKILIIENS